MSAYLLNALKHLLKYLRDKVLLQKEFGERSLRNRKRFMIRVFYKKQYRILLND